MMREDSWHMTELKICGTKKARDVSYGQREDGKGKESFGKRKEKCIRMKISQDH